jgi:hypothetical protein
MKVLYGSLIFFFYFIKYPVAIFLPIGYFYLDFVDNPIMDMLWVISIILIIKDKLYPHENNCDSCKIKNTE